MSHSSKHDSQNVTIAVITISDTRTLPNDTSGHRIVELCTHAGYTIVSRDIVPDEILAIRAAIRTAIEMKAQVVIATGGTGIAQRDVTIEAIEPLLQKKLDGFGEAFRRLSWDEIGPKSMLSRAVAGSCNHTLLIALPGSTAAIELGITRLVLPILGHAVALLN